MADVVVFDVADAASLAVLCSALAAERRMLTDELALLAEHATENHRRDLVARLAAAKTLCRSLSKQTGTRAAYSAERGCSL